MRYSVPWKINPFPRHPQTNVQRLSDTGMGKKYVFESRGTERGVKEIRKYDERLKSKEDGRITEG